MVTPERSLEQRRRALVKANVIRSNRAQLKKDMKAGKVQLRDLLLDDPPEWLLTMKIIDILLATPKIGRVKAMQRLTAARISPSKTLGGMTMRQRAELVTML